MKKALLSLAGGVCLAVSAYANEANVTFSENDYPSGAPVEYVQTDGHILLNFSKGSIGSVPSYNASQSSILINKANTFTVSGAADVSITHIDLNFSSPDYAGLDVTAGGGTTTAVDNTCTWTGSANSVEFTAVKTSYLTSVKVTYSGSGTISTPEVSDIESFISSRPDATTAIQDEATVVYQSPSTSDYKWLFIKDNTGWLCVSGNTYRTYSPGDILPGGFQGSYIAYGDGTPQLTNPRDFKASTRKGNEIAPIPAQLSNLSSCPLNALVSIDGTTINPVADNATNYTCAADGQDITLRNLFKIYISPGTGRTVTGFLIKEDSGYNICPISVTDSEGREYVKTPVISPASGEIWADDKITLTCATPDAEIYYTLDGTQPTASSTLYSAPFSISKNSTITAIAVKAGMANSAETTGVFTVKVMPANTAIFKFNDPASIMTVASYGDVPTAQFAGMTATTTLGDNMFLSGCVTIASTAGTPVINKGTKIEFRPGKGAKFTISGNGNKIKSITFTGSKINNITTTADGNFNASEGTYIAPDGGVESVEFSTPASGFQASISTITVECADNMTGITEITDSYNNTTVEYYNLQGIRVANPSNGIFVRRQGNKVDKVLIP